MNTTGRFIATRGFVIGCGHEVRAGDQIDLDDSFLIEDLLTAGKIEARDAQTKRRIEWREDQQWTPTDHDKLRAYHEGYDPLLW